MLQFQSTLPREERRSGSKAKSKVRDFNPRSHERSDQQQRRSLRQSCISIHAPTRGATVVNRIWKSSKGFQSTLPREERLYTGTITDNQKNFNPRSHERSDVWQVINWYSRPLFQSTLPREERPMRHCNRVRAIRFQSTLPREERLISFTRSFCVMYFNPRSHERSDRTKTTSDMIEEISIHAPTRGATAILHKKFVYFYTIPTINI